MTASHVNGVTVIHSEPAESPLSRAGRPIFFKQIHRLLLEDGGEAFGCVHCDYTHTQALPVRSHLKAHSNGTRKKKATGPGAEMSLTELLEKVRQLKDIEAERDEWKRRAREAERKLAALRKALAP